LTEGYHEYYLCGDKSLESIIRDQVLTSKRFETPPEYLRNRMFEIADIMKVKDTHDVSVFASEDNVPFNYRIEVINVFTKEQLFELEELGFVFESIGHRDESIVLWLKEGLK
jgi:hypothetical protein